MLINAYVHSMECAKRNKDGTTLLQHECTKCDMRQKSTPVFVIDRSLEKKWKSIVGENGPEISELVELLNSDVRELQEGSAPHSKHIFVLNPTSLPLAAMPVTPENVGKLKSGYVTRYSKELPWLQRWFLASEVGVPPVAKWLHFEVYTREKIEEEDGEKLETKSPYIVIGIKGTAEPVPNPNFPSTMVNNALGTKWGGSGVPLDEEALRKAAAFWEVNATVRT